MRKSNYFKKLDLNKKILQWPGKFWSIPNRIGNEFYQLFRPNRFLNAVVLVAFFLIISLSIFIPILLSLSLKQPANSKTVVSNFFPFNSPPEIFHFMTGEDTSLIFDSKIDNIYYRVYNDTILFHMPQNKWKFIAKILLDPEIKVHLTSKTDFTQNKFVKIHPLIISQELYSVIFRYSAILLIVLIPLMMNKLTSYLRL